MMDSIQSHSHTHSRSNILFTESVVVDDDDSSHLHSISEHSSEAFESFIDEHFKTLSQFKAGLNTASDTVRPASQSTQQLEAGSLDENNEHSDVYSTTHNLKILLNAVCKAAAVISSVISDLLTAVCQETAVISDSSIDNLFIDEEI
ncbi:hypothetical protein BDDG_13079 [Blastomyces dermatitidis ATCC 18188]|uniref:Uncharacterized protein n=1 Tax=Ajellomyces dermatitidis (strain ATCC 18188 / CBS 674.68) TaxID=653446 RepID=A0A0J9EUH7_AJEDA|nr:hypothetical protein BDDG_13079 [Blastomyces dermatitidis ATCC 18188]